MKNPNMETLAKNLVGYSISVQPGEKVLLDLGPKEPEIAKALVRAVYAAGGKPFLTYENQEVMREWLTQADADQIRLEAAFEKMRMEAMDCYIAIRAKDNIYELSGVPEEKMRLYNTLLLEPVHHEIRVAKTKWVVLRYPNHAMAQEAKMSTEAFEEFYYKVCNLDYAKMSVAMDPLHRLLSESDRVRISAPGTELSFSIKGIGAVKCDGHCNIPDGEVYTAPVIDSVEGEIRYNLPSSYQGQVFENVHFVFEKGKIVHATAGPKTEALNKILDTDPGARYIGEFAFGLNPHILWPINDILFDEKIAGSFHFTPGACYADAYNGNKSAVHWDLVMSLRPEAGGGEIYLDDRLIHKDGRFCIKELEALNPENLV